MIKNGLIQVTSIFGVPFKQDLIPVTNKTARPQIKMTPQYITIHNTGNSRKGADANANSEYVDTNTGYISWHFTVDDKQIIQELPINETAWHAGDGRRTGNMKSIGIEICENEGINWEVAKANAVKLITYLIKYNPKGMIPFFSSGLSIKSVVPHQKWSGKYCPHKILDEGWGKFIAQISKYGIVEQAKDLKLLSNVSYWQNVIDGDEVASASNLCWLFANYLKLGHGNIISLVGGAFEKKIITNTGAWYNILSGKKRDIPGAWIKTVLERMVK